jgi:hypothetical protein
MKPFASVQLFEQMDVGSSVEELSALFFFSHVQVSQEMNHRNCLLVHC